MTPQQFLEKWKRADLKERSAYQEHFLDVCRLIGHPTPGEADPHGTWFTFEAFANKRDGGNGFADVWKKNFFAWEYKGKHADLDRAYRQLLQYREALFNPPLLVVCDIDRIIIHTNFTNTAKQEIEITLDALLTPQGRAQLAAVFNDPKFFQTAQTTEQVTQQAAQEFGKLAQILHKQGIAPEQTAHFLIRLLFCLFAEDVGLLPNNIFTKLMHRTWAHASDLTQQLRELFRAMARGGIFALEDIKHFNGGLFDDDAAYDLDAASLRILLGVSELDWSSVEPSIFGELFQRSLDPAKRSQIGAHYTGKDDILLVVEPVLMLPLRRRWDEIKIQAHALAAQRDAISGASPAGRAKRARFDKQLQTLLMEFRAEIARLRILDPAAGSGNFLYIALRLLLDLEKEVMALMAELQLTPAFPTVHPAQLFAIEINPYAYELAQATIWIGYIQWLHENGYGFPPEPILKRLDNFRNIDAILNLRGFENLEGLTTTEPQWQPADIIVGNPPFLGDKKMRAELGDEYVDALRTLYEGRIPGQSDLVCYWFEKARAMIEQGIVKRAGLLATQGIRGGANRRVLERIKASGDIFMAWSDRDWVLDGATVHVSIIGFDDGREQEKHLEGLVVSNINSDLSAKADLTSARILKENKGLSFIGTQKSGPFDLTAEQAQAMIAAKGNPNGRSNRDVIKPWINALDVTGQPRNMYVIDFGIEMPLDQAAKYEMPFEYVKKHVKPLRDKVNRKNHRERWWLFGESRPGMRKAIEGLKRFLVVPMVSKYKVFVWIPAGIIPENLLVVIARDDDYFFGVLHSHTHELWARAMGTQLREAESGQRYTPTTTFETFPFPFPPGQEKQDDPRVVAIADAARELVQLRHNWLNPPDVSDDVLKKRTLTNLYNQNPQWLQNAHRKLDAAVFAAYGWRADFSDDEILTQLLALNLERAPL